MCPAEGYDVDSPIGRPIYATKLKPSDIKTFADLERYLAEFANFGGDPVPYYFVGTFVLFIALLDNLAAHHLDADLENLVETDFHLSEQQRAFLSRLLAMTG